MKNNDNWDLTSLYQNENDPQINKDLESLKEKTKVFAKKLQGKISDCTGAEIYEIIKEYESLYELIGKISTFAYLYFVTEMTNQNKAIFYQNISEKLNDLASNLIFVPLEISALSEKEMALKLENTNLQKYKPYIDNLRTTKPYQKSQEIEEILHEKEQTSNSSWSRLFDETMAGLEFEFKGEKLPSSEIFSYLASHNAESRKLAAASIGRVLQDNIKLFTFISNTLAKDKEIEDRIRKFPNPIKSRNVDNFIEDEIVENLSNTIKENYSALAHRYYKLKAKIFNKENLYYWDRNAPLPNSKEGKISWDDAKKIVLDAYNEFSPKMAGIAELFFVNGWIDAKPKKGKDAGAFAHPATPSTNPFIMLNFQGKIRDVMTLAHELGHGIHQYLSKGQGYLMADTPLTLAETASIFGEQLIFESLLNKCQDDDEKRTLLSNKIEDSLNTIVRQIGFHFFEVKVHNKRKDGELSSDDFAEIWLETQQESLGSNIILHDEYKNYWSYIPHFIHSPFYVYAYAFGNCLVNSLYAGYKQGIEGFEDKYIAALSSGGSLHHKELLSPFGLDASKKDFWQKGLELPISYIDEFEKLL